MKKVVGKFWNEELGSIVFDWFVLAAGIGSLSVAVVTTIA